MAKPSHPNEPGTATKPANGAPPPQSLELSRERADYLAEQYGHTPQQINVVRNAICIGATDAELEFFLATCKRVGLDPFAQQIWFVKRRQKIEDAWGNESWVDVGRPMTSIDGYRTIAERTGEYKGQSPIQWCGLDGKWCDVWLKEGPPHAARATIHRSTFNEPLIAVAHFNEYCPKYNNGKMPAMWIKMGANQIAKCAEALGFRRAFPRDLSGLVTDTEMEHVDAGTASYSAPAVAALTTKAITERAPDKAAAIIDATATEQREPVTTSLPGPGEGAGVQVAHERDAMTDIDIEMVRHIGSITGAQKREDLSEVGAMITAAKGKDDAFSVTVIQVLKPALEKRWRELAPKKTR